MFTDVINLLLKITELLKRKEFSSISTKKKVMKNNYESDRTNGKYTALIQNNLVLKLPWKTHIKYFNDTNS